MADEDDLGFTPDEIGEWSERKIEIVREYAKPFSQIISKNGLTALYVDGLAGGGEARRKRPRTAPDSATLPLTIDGTPLSAGAETILTTAARIVSEVTPRFAKYIFIDADRQKTLAMQHRCSELPDINVDVINSDVSQTFLARVIPEIRASRKNRALCFLDPYGMHISWNVFQALGATGHAEVFINFPTLDIVRNVLRDSPSLIEPQHAERMNLLWGDDFWRQVAFKKQPGLFDAVFEKQSGDHIAMAFQERLIHHGGFKFVSKPLPFKNKQNGLLYHLLFATQKKVALKIANAVMKKWARPIRRGLNG
ncbi:MAG: three-Cys-motif partner protein TcmP [Tagaea sp.]